MGLRDLARLMFGRGDAPTQPAEADGLRFEVVADSDGVNVVMGREALAAVGRGEGGVASAAAFVALRMLEEQGLAEPEPGGWHVASADAVRLDAGLRDVLGLPSPYTGRWRALVDSHTSSTTFRVRLVVDLDGVPTPVRGHGPFVTVGSEQHTATPGQLTALDAVAAHTALPATGRTELANAQLVATLQQAADDGLDIDLAHFTRGGWTTERVDAVGVRAEAQPDGSLVLAPSLGTRASAEELAKRWHQVPESGRGGVLRVGKDLILLDEDAVGAAQEVLRHRVIPASDVQTFLRTPSAFLDAALVDLDLGFSVRVAGIGRVVHVDFAGAEASGTDWFAHGVPLDPEALLGMVGVPDDLVRFEAAYRAASRDDADVVRFDTELIDVRDPDKVDTVVDRLREDLATHGARELAPGPTPTAGNDTTEDTRRENVGYILRDTDSVVTPLHDRARAAIAGVTLDTTGLARQPFPHQRDGITWMLGMMHAAREAAADDLYRLQGAILADDMGLGKTYMSLVAIRQLNTAVAAEVGARHVKPTLVVAPLSLIENWEDEVAKTFVTPPFSDTVVLQSQRDLPRFRVRGAARETTQLSRAVGVDGMIDPSQLRIALHVGSGAGIRRLDVPGRLVLTTYETLRDYQFSLGQVDWSVVVFDEAQRIKNPDAGVTRAAKALKAEFKLLVTGTPVENSLGEFWCLVDTAQPGLLGDWAAFRATYMRPASDDGSDADEKRAELGRRLRDAVGPFMLRRSKEDHLEGLPAKIVHTGVKSDAGLDLYDGRLDRVMPDVQRRAYDAHLRRFRSARLTGEKTSALSVLMSLRLASMHPELDVHDRHPAFPASHDDTASAIAQSAKLQAVFDVLRGIRDSEEKVIVFVLSKTLQLLLALWVRQEFGFQPDIVNGNTKAVSGGGSRSRREIIRRFENAVGFSVIIMSPVAAGVGLTIVGANHVIHLERHWNPAKEAQATDRVYRIGQTRDVHVYHPVARHPGVDSFDILIDRLLRRKTSVKDSVMVQPEIVPDEVVVALADGGNG